MRRVMDRYADRTVDASTFHRLALLQRQKQTSWKDIMKHWLIGLLLMIVPAAQQARRGWPGQARP
jgi:hypothetical protein